MQTTKEQRDKLKELDRQFQQPYGPHDEKPDLLALRKGLFRLLYEMMPALLADAERAERMEKVLRNILGSWGTIQLADAVIEARAALGETT